MSRGKTWRRMVESALSSSASTVELDVDRMVDLYTGASDTELTKAIGSQRERSAENLVSSAMLIADTYERMIKEGDGQRRPRIELRCTSNRVLEVAGPLGLDGIHLSIRSVGEPRVITTVHACSDRGADWIRNLLADTTKRKEVEGQACRHCAIELGGDHRRTCGSLERGLDRRIEVTKVTADWCGPNSTEGTVQ
jgi:hypothetical protein